MRDRDPCGVLSWTCRPRRHRASHPIGSLAARAGTPLRCLTWPFDGSTEEGGGGPMVHMPGESEFPYPPVAGASGSGNTDELTLPGAETLHVDAGRWFAPHGQTRFECRHFSRYSRTRTGKHCYALRRRTPELAGRSSTGSLTTAVLTRRSCSRSPRPNCGPRRRPAALS
jgi:hypothetical protein